MSTVNDFALTEHLVQAAAMLQHVSRLVRDGDLRAAAELASELHAITRQLDWRIHELLTKEKP